MKLTAVRVQNYKCIDDSGEFSINDLTCLAGKNESGKTALLQALRRLNPVEDAESNFNEGKEYPRRRLLRANKGGPSAREVLTTTWDLSQEDLTAVKNVVGPNAIQKSVKVSVRRGYDNKTEWEFEIDESQIIPFVVDKVPQLSESAKKCALSHSTLEGLYSWLTSLVEPNEGENLLREYIERHFPDNNPSKAVSNVLADRLPRFLYFPTYGTLPGQVKAEDIESKANNEDSQSESDRFFLALLALANTDVKALRNTQRYEELKARLESVSNHLSDEIFEYWTQNRQLTVQVDYGEALQDDPPPFNTGHILRLRVYNLRHRVSVEFDERSAGFIWFLSFLVWFSQMERKYGDKLIILLDEPGLSLHGKAQGDLLRYMKEKLLPKYQIIYTTHSPFMIDTENILGVRTVEDVVENNVQLGTKVSGRVFSGDADTLLPLRAALGYDITQSLFVGEHSLLVEGPSDLLFLQWFSRQLANRRRTGLDARWTITPVGGIAKFSSFNALFGANKLHVAILTDFQSGEKRKIRELEESGLLEAGRLFYVTQFVEQEEADIEDMLGKKFYFELVNQCYDLKRDERLSNNARSSNAPARMIKEVEQHFQTVATETLEFSHLSPAVYLFEHGDDFSETDGIEEALGRFENLFKRVNDLLPKV